MASEMRAPTFAVVVGDGVGSVANAVARIVRVGDVN